VYFGYFLGLRGILVIF